MPMHNNGWTDERRDRCKEMWALGYTASQISKELGGVSRNAVLGVIHRMGVAARQLPSKPEKIVYKAPPAPKAPGEPRPQRFVPTIAMAAPVLPISVPGRPPTEADYAPPASNAFIPLAGSSPQTLEARPEGACAWPVGEDDDGQMLVCCLPSVTRWCAQHDAMNRAKAPRTKTSAIELARSLRRYI
jgi:GcrA cell cycle regulator